MGGACCLLLAESDEWDADLDVRFRGRLFFSPKPFLRSNLASRRGFRVHCSTPNLVDGVLKRSGQKNARILSVEGQQKFEVHQVMWVNIHEQRERKKRKKMKEKKTGCQNTYRKDDVMDFFFLFFLDRNS